MDSKQPDWDLYRSFLAVLRAGSLSGAARELGLAQPTLGRHIDALEAALGLPLFVRSQHGFLPTEGAQHLRRHAEALDASARALLRAASGASQPGRGTVRITASDVIGCEALPPILTRLHAAHPGLQIELALSDQIEDLLLREADIAVRMVRPTQEALIGRRVGAITVGMYAHRDYLARAGTPATPDDLRGHTLIGFDHENAYIRSVKHHLGGLSRSAFTLRTDSNLAQLAAIRAGVGIGMCQVAIARRDPQLVRLLPQQMALALDTWIVMHEDLRENALCAVVFAALAEGLAAYADDQR